MAATGATVAFIAAAVAALAGTAHACDGYTVKDMQIKPCEGRKNVVELKDLKPELTPQCTFKAVGCYKTNITVESSWTNFVVKKDGTVVNQGEQEGCEFLEDNKDNDNTRPFLDALSMPMECPVPPGEYCGNGKEASMHKFRPAMSGFVGKYTVHMDMDFGNGNEACFDGSFELVSPIGL
ncbi:uncharacterized protein LOC126094744 [Schistocerca cancellata]|uniref:uncharacterized protein LOC126094744 n=1 Tax=Schistocerca cancellata TaxID=274614 RepID=UPI0021180588|nr:uncharacterized protein LOC126094744 [Schistocerca cancellata]